MSENRDANLGAALGQVPSGLYILTVGAIDAPIAERAAVLVSWVQQVSFDPAAVSVAISSERAVLPLLEPGTAFALNQIPEGDKTLMAAYARGVGANDDPFARAETESGPSGTTLLTAASAWLVAQVEAIHETLGEHTLVVGRLSAGDVRDAEARPWVHLRKTGYSY